MGNDKNKNSRTASTMLAGNVRLVPKRAGGTSCLSLGCLIVRPGSFQRGERKKKKREMSHLPSGKEVRDVVSRVNIRSERVRL
jgi:hypothetical protein